jgi:hypothetical protein
LFSFLLQAKNVKMNKHNKMFFNDKCFITNNLIWINNNEFFIAALLAYKGKKLYGAVFNCKIFHFLKLSISMD